MISRRDLWLAPHARHTTPQTFCRPRRRLSRKLPLMQRNNYKTNKKIGANWLHAFLLIQFRMQWLICDQSQEVLICLVQTPDFNRKFTHFAKKKCNNPLPASAKSNWAKNNRRKPRVDRMEWSVACNRRLSTSNAPICFRMCPLKQTKPHVRHSEFSRCKPISFKFCFKTVPTRCIRQARVKRIVKWRIARPLQLKRWWPTGMQHFSAQQTPSTNLTQTDLEFKKQVWEFLGKLCKTLF